MTQTSILPDLLREQVSRGLEVTVRVFGHSMVPLIWPGSRLIVARWPKQGPRVGDIAAIRVRDHVVFHLVHHVNREERGSVLFTRGLASLQADPPTREPEWIGQVVRIQCGLLSFRTDRPLFCAARAVAEGLGPLWGLARAAYLRLRDRMSRMSQV